MAKTKQQISVRGRRITVSNLDKILYPAAKFSKRDVIDYYTRISKFLLPHLKNHPVTLKRFPDGVRGEFFYEKEAPFYTPSWIKTFPVPRRESGNDIHYIVINNLPTLVWLSNLANLEIHPFLHRVPRIDRPTAMVFDCDPGPGADILTCARVAQMLRDLLGELELESFPKVSGSKGLQVYVPLNSAVSYDETGATAKALAELLERREPKLVVSKMTKKLRTRKVFIDWSQNADSKSTVAVYSLRAKKDRPYVSVPVSWDELGDALKSKDREQLFFTPADAIERVEEHGDLFAPVLTKVQKLPGAVREYFAEKDTKRPATKNALKPYLAKRNFKKTAEPKPTSLRTEDGSRFVIQKHAASHLHYDFRLEMDGVLKSWSVPKGPPVKVGDKRLAMPTEDHPVEYIGFEGIIPKGEYGGGTVMVWDAGTYDLIEGNYHNGFVRFNLNGSKLKGEWMLQRFVKANAERDKREKWLLSKARKNARVISRKRDDQSAISKRTMAQIAKAADARWHSNRK